jgi:hypothetical protein
MHGLRDALISGSVERANCGHVLSIYGGLRMSARSEGTCSPRKNFETLGAFQARPRNE